MQEEIRQVACRVKELRELSGFSIESIAEELGMDIETYRSYESGTTDIPVGALMKLAQKFRVELSTLLTGEEPRLHTYSLTRKEKGASVERRKEYKYQSLAPQFSHKKAEPFIVTVEPEAEGTPFHLNSHPGQEFNYVLEGSMKVSIGGHEVVLIEGDSLFFDSGVLHGMKALDGKKAKFLAVIM